MCRVRGRSVSELPAGPGRAGLRSSEMQIALRRTLCSPSCPPPHSPGPRAVSHVPGSSQVFPGEETRVGFVSCSKSETQALLNSSVAKGTEPKGQKARWGWG